MQLGIWNLRALRDSAVLILLCCAPSRAQITEKAIKVTVAPKNVAVVTAGPVQLHWVVDPLPVKEDISVSNPKVQQVLADALGELASRKPQCLAWYAEKKGSCSLSDTLAESVNERISGLAFAIVGPKDFVRAPASGQSPPASPIELAATYTPPKPDTVKSLSIRVSTANSDGSPIPALKTGRRTLGELAAQFGLGTPAAPGVLVDVQYTEADLNDGRGGVFDAAKILHQLFDVAIAAYKEAESSNLLPAAQDPEARRSDAEQHVQSKYTIHHSDWPKVSVQFGSNGGGDYVFAVSHLHIVKFAHVRLTPGSVVAYNDAALRLILQQAAAKVDARFKTELATLDGVVPTDDAVWRLATVVTQAKPPEITGVVVPIRGEKQEIRNGVSGGGLRIKKAEPDDDLVFQAEHQWFFSSIESKGDLGITTNANELISGQTQFSEENLGGFVHTSAVTVKGGPKLQRGDFDFDITRARACNVVTFGFHLNGRYLRDENQKFGYLRGPAFTDEEWGPTPKVFLEVAPSQGRWHFDTRIEAPFEFRHMNILPPDGLAVNPARGWVSAFTPTLHQGLMYDLTRYDSNKMPLGHFGPLDLVIDAGAMRARPGLGGDFDFNRYSVTGRLQGFVGVTGPQDFLVRYVRGFGVGSGSIPLSELFRLGGTGSIRGIEEGEYVGRNIAFDQSELGVNAASAWRWISRKPASSPKPAGAAPSPASQLSKLGISSIFVVGFYDRGRLPSGSSLGEVLDLSGAFHGYGFKAELRGLHVGTKLGNLSLGYARSPDSVLHHHGIFITAFSLDF